MPSVRRSIPLLLVLGVIAVIGFRAGAGRGQPVVEKKEALTPFYYGAAACKSCHTTPPDAGYQPVCECKEYPIWATKDKHGEAYKVLLEARSKQMGIILGKDVTNDVACLACHSVVAKGPDVRDESFKKTEGVTCGACHGMAKKWVAMHSPPFKTDREAWRAKTREEKEQQYGMTDLWSPIKRAELCASCHIGNIGEGKFVTHDMYAAGHPPLPGFEVASFSDGMPRHWQYLREKKGLSEELKQKYHYVAGEHEQTKLVLVGAAVSLRESMKLLRLQAEACEKATKADLRALDLANFDCYSCHHDLKSPSWRQNREGLGKPGRVPMSAWPTALVRLTVRHSAADADKKLAEFDSLLGKAREAFDAQPFGSPTRIKAAAKKLEEWAAKLAVEANEKTYGTKVARAVLADLPKFDKKQPLDYDSARQVAWALNTLHKEHQEIAKTGPDPEIARLLASLNKNLRLTFPEGRGSISTKLPESLRAIYAYEPGPFEKTMREIGERLPSPLPKRRPRDR